MSLLQKRLPTERLIPILLFVFVSSVYFATVTGVTSSNDGGQYAATRAFADYGRFDVAPFFPFVEGQDYTIDQYGAVHSHLPPGTPIVASAVYRLGQLAPEPFVQVPSKHDGHNPRVIYAVLTAVLAASATVVLFYSILRHHFDLSVAAALLAALALAFGTATWKYGTVLYSHALASLALFVTLFVVLRAERRGAIGWPDALLLGFALGAAVLFEYTNAVLVVIVLLYFGLTQGRQLLAARRSSLAVLGAFALGSGLPFAFFLGYNVALYGGPFSLSYYFVDPVRWACCATLQANLSGNVLQGMQGFLLYANQNQGLFLLSPIAVLALPGWITLYRRSRRNFALLLGIFVAFLILFSMRSIPNPGTNDGRYLVPFLGLWFVPLGLWLDTTYFPAGGEIRRALLSLLVFGLLFLSVRNVAAHIALSWGYDLDLSALENRSFPPFNLAIIGSTLFPNTLNLPLLWLLEGIALGFGLAFVAVRRALTPRLRPALTGAALLVVAAFTLAPVMREPTPPGMLAHERAFGDDLRLLGYQLTRWKADSQPGDSVRVRLYWQLDAPVGELADVRLALVDDDGTTWGQTETPLGLATFRRIPITTWPEGRIIQEEYTIPLDDVPPYALQANLTLTVGDYTETLVSLRPATLTLASPPDHPLDYQLDGLAYLTGYDAEPLPYGRLAVTLHWQVTGATDAPYTIFVHLVAADGTLVAQQDAPPFAGRYPTTDWRPGESLADTYVLTPGRAVSSGTYSLRAGLYNPGDGTRLPVTGPGGQPVPDNAALLGDGDGFVNSR